MMLQVGDIVEIEPSAEDDCTIEAWKTIQQNPHGVIRALVGNPDKPASLMGAVEFTAPFAGGIDCNHTCLPRQGQYIMSQNLSLCFEASREVVTVPTIGG